MWSSIRSTVTLALLVALLLQNLDNTFAQCGSMSGYQYTNTLLSSAYQIAWTLNTANNTLSIAMAAKTSGWVGVGISQTNPPQMIGSEAVIGWATGGSLVSSYKLNAKDPNYIAPYSNVIPLFNYTACTFQNNGDTWTYISFIRFISSGLNHISTTGVTPMVFAYGLQPGIIAHAPNDMTAQTVNLATGSFQQSQQQNQTNMEKIAHGSLMFTGFGVLIPAGMIFARYGKPLGSFWIHIHYSIQFFGYLCGFAGFVLAMIMVDRLHFATHPHEELGMTVITCALAQLFLGFLRPDHAHEGQKKTTARFLWEIIHTNFGRCIIILSAVTLYYGLYTYGAPTSLYIALSVYIGVLILLIIGLEIHMRVMESRKGKQEEEFELKLQ